MNPFGRWRALPWDGEGWAPSPDPDLAAARAWSAARARGRVAAGLRPGLRAADRLAWAGAALIHTRAFARRHGLGRAATGRLFLDGLLSGGLPADVQVWRGLHGSRHPLPARAAGLLLSRLGDPAGHALLADKLAAAERLDDVGLAVPALHLVIDGGAHPDGREQLRDAPDRLFVKPRHGSGGRGAFALTRSGDGWRMDDGALLPRGLLEARAAPGALLVQERLTVHPDLADLADADRPPVLRLTTARLPGGAPALQAALIEIPVPGRDPRHFLDGVVRAPIDLARGRMGPGILFARPGERLAALPWNGAPLSGRAVPGFAEAAAAALAAAAAVPPLPLIGWDIVPAPWGPVVLEGNSGGNWIVTTLAARLGFGAGPPPGRVLAAWCAAASIDRPRRGDG